MHDSGLWCEDEALARPPLHQSNAELRIVAGVTHLKAAGFLHERSAEGHVAAPQIANLLTPEHHARMWAANDPIELAREPGRTPHLPHRKRQPTHASDLWIVIGAGQQLKPA